MTARLIDHVMPGVIESLVPVRSMATKSRAHSAKLLADARRLTINLLTFVAAARQQQLPLATIRKGMRLLSNAMSPTRAGLAKQSNIDVVEEFLSRSAAKCWQSLAPRHAVVSELSRKPAGQALLAESNARFAEALAALIGDSNIELLEQGFPGFTTRVLGSLHEALLGHRLNFNNDKPRLITDQDNRRRSGSFYTPEPLVRLLVEKTIGPVLRRRIQQVARGLNAALAHQHAASTVGFSLFDPAMGSGHFLTAALEYSTQKIIRASEKYGLPAPELARRIVASPRRHSIPNTSTAASHPAGDRSRLKQILLDHSIFGADTDPDTVELARLSLWLDSGLPATSLKSMVRHLSTGDSLLSEEKNKFRPNRFDAIIGNPPYGTPDQAYRQRLRRVLPQTRHNSDLAAAFVERSLELVDSAGQVGLVLPKPLTYSFAWRHLRQSLQQRTVWICDVRRGWEQVLAEQVLLVIAGSDLSRTSHQVGAMEGRASRSLPDIPNSWTERFGVLLSSLTTDDCQRLQSMRFSAESVGDHCRTFRGLPWQRRLGATGERPVYGGRDLERWSVRSTSGFILGDANEQQLKTFAQPKLLFQNIIAHIGRPEPHVRLIGTLDQHGSVTLDTVNNLVARNAEVNLQAMLSLLHSAAVNWLVYSIVYNRAIRTMHFDQYFLNKIPLPLHWERVAPQLAELAGDCLAATRQLKEANTSNQPNRQGTKLVAKLAKAQTEIDRVTAQAYSDRGWRVRD